MRTPSVRLQDLAIYRDSDHAPGVRARVVDISPLAYLGSSEFRIAEERQKA